jgi:predicted AAA+ superfamily ATPase
MSLDLLGRTMALLKRRSTHPVRPEFFLWRTQVGAEVDLLLVDGRRIVPVEIKAGAAVDHYSIAGLRHCMQDLGLRRGWVVSTARERRQLGHGIEVVPWSEIASGSIELF